MLPRPSMLSVFALALLPVGLLAAEEAIPKASPPTAPLKSITVFPPQVGLDGPRDEQRLIVLGTYADGRQWDLTRTAKYASKAAATATVDALGVIRPVADGEAAITVDAGGQSATVPVKVQRARADLPVNFNREIVPILTKATCNGGACHGSQHGRGGFKLSLFGFDPAFDHNQIVQSAEGRRIVLSDPERSILLQKPTQLMEHQGGERFKVGSREYNALRGWLEDAVPPPTAKDAEVKSIEVWPAKRIMLPGEQQQTAVRAHWTDGRVEDVTFTAQFDSLNDAVAAISPDGLITAKSTGETHIMVRFNGQVGVVQVTLPFAKLNTYPDVPKNNFIDKKLIAKWKDLGLVPAPLCSDEEFFRRIHLDTIGTLPSPADVTAFLADKSADKRAKAIDRVIDRPEFVDFWALKWSDHLRISRVRLQEKGMWSFYNWVRGAIRDNKTVDEFVRDIITAEGSTFTEGPANYYRGGTPTDYAETTSQLFLGVRITCAKCHHHPFEKWSQDDYYGMMAFFVRMGTKNSQEFGIFGGESIIHLRPNGEQSHPRKGGVVKPHPLDGPEMDDEFDRRRKLAEWMTAKDNPFFARNMVNRFWGYYMGHGLVEPLDDIRSTNPASNPELLDALAQDFAEHKFDFKHLLRRIMNSRAYQLGSDLTPGNSADKSNIYFARYLVKRLTAEQLADAVDFVTGTREKYRGLPAGTRAIQLPDTAVTSFLLDVFGRPPRKITCECERTVQPNIAQALHMLNGDTINQKIGNDAGRIETLLRAKKPLPAIVEELYLATFSRPPKPEELARAQELVTQSPSPKEGLHDLLWALMNSREFLFNH